MSAVTTQLQDEGYQPMGAAFEVYNYLVNFGHKATLEWKRFILTDKK